MEDRVAAAEVDDRETVKTATPRQVRFGDDTVHFFKPDATGTRRRKRKKDKISSNCLNETESSSASTDHPNTRKRKLRSSKSSTVLDLYKFVFEDMVDNTWQDLSTEQQKHLMQQGPFAMERMSYVSTIHVVQQAPTDVQMTVCNDLCDMPHGHTMGPTPLPCEIPGTKLRTVKPVRKLNKAYNKIQTTTIKNKTLQSLLYRGISYLDKNIKKQAGNEVRQRHYMDFGYTSGQSQGRVDDDNTHTSGLARPTPCQATFDTKKDQIVPFVDELFDHANRTINRHARFVWDDLKVGSNRQQNFGGRICPNNKIEGMRLTYSYMSSKEVEGETKKGLCKMHVDSKNDRRHSEVVVLSSFFWEEEGVSGWRVALICYTRQSISDYMGRAENTYGEAIRELLDVYDTRMEPYRKDGPSLATYLGRGKVLTQIAYDGETKYQGFHCHVDPLVYVSNIASSIT